MANRLKDRQKDKLKDNGIGEVRQSEMKLIECERGVRAKGTDLEKVDWSESEMEAECCLTGSRC